MEAHRVLYFTDGSDVVVSDLDFQVRDTSYPLNEIFSHRVAIVLPHRAPFAAMTAVGALVFLCGAFDLFPTLNKSMAFLGITVLANAAVMVLGIAVMLLGMFAMFRSRDRYVVKLSTPRGEKTALVSHRRDYVDHINEALNTAHLDQKKKPAKRMKYSR